MVSLTGIQLVVLDLDDTLYPERAYAFSGFAAVGDWLSRRGACPFDPAERMRALFEAGDRRRIFNQLLAEMAFPPDEIDRWVSQMIQVYRSHLPTLTLFPDADDALRRWRPRFGLGLISDGPLEVQQNKVEALELSARLDWVLLTDLWGREFWKPHLRAFLEAESRGGVSGAACVYVADNPSKDFVGPRQRGWRTVQIHREDAVHQDAPTAAGGEAEHHITSLAEVVLSS